LTGQHCSHPVGTGIGAAVGAAAGAPIGSIAGGLGGGRVIGAIVGGLAESIDPTAEEDYWREHFSSEPYYRADKDFADYGPAYQLGVARFRHDSAFEDHEDGMAADWEDQKESSTRHKLEARCSEGELGPAPSVIHGDGRGGALNGH
jgi:hypothetical protein